MSVILLPKKWTKQPQYPAQLKARYQSGIGGSLYLGTHVPLTPNTLALTTSEAIVTVPTTHGLMAKVSDGSGYWGANNNYPANYFDRFVGGEHSLIFVHRPVTVTNNKGYIGLYQSAGGVLGVELRRNGSGLYEYRYNGATTAGYTTDVTADATARCIVIATDGIDDSSPVIAINGVQTNLTVTTATTPKTAIDTFTIGLDSGFNTVTSDVGFYLWLPFRIKNPIEISANPWQIFESIQRKIYVPTAGGGSTTYTSTASLDAAIQQARTATASLGAAIQQNRAATASIGAAIQAAFSATASLDGAIQRAASATTSLDAYIAAAGAQTANASLDAAIQQARTATASLGAAVQAALATSASIDSAVLFSGSATSGMDAYVQAAGSNAVIASLDAAIQGAGTATAALGAAIQEARSATASLGASVQVSGSASASVDAYILAGSLATASLEAAIMATVGASASLNAYIYVASDHAALSAPRTGAYSNTSTATRSNLQTARRPRS